MTDPYTFWSFIVLILFCGCELVFADTQEEYIVRELYRCATRGAPASIKVRALVHYTEPRWTKEQIEEQVGSLMERLHDNSRETAQKMRSSVAAAHAGVRWALYEETKLPNFYRIDTKNYYDVQPNVDDELVYSNGVFESYHINNYGRNDLPYKEMQWDKHSGSEVPNKESNLQEGTVIIDNSKSPLVWSQVNLFLAGQLEGQACLPFILHLCQQGDPVMLQKLMGAARLENMGLAPAIPLDDSKLHDLLNGRNSSVKVKIKGGASKKESVVEFSFSNANDVEVARYTLDENLSYLVSKVSIAGRDYEYTSERTGTAQLGFPSVWRTGERRPDGKNTAREVWILSVTTNIVLSTAVATNYLPGAAVWEKTGDGKMKRVVGADSRPAAPHASP
jgi:hypothetical protein